MPSPRPSVERPSEDVFPLQGLLIFEHVARHLSFSRAAAELGVTPTAISKAVKSLETQLGVRLFNRTTRSVALTESGSSLRDALVPALEQIRHALGLAGEAARGPHGLLRVNVSYVAYCTHIEPHLQSFLDRYPQIQLEISLDNRLSDIVRRGFDVGIRFGRALQRDMVGVPIGRPQRLLVVASPALLARVGAPRAPEDLLRFDCIRQHLGGRNEYLEWRFQAGPRVVTIDARGRLTFDEMRSVLQAARLGSGFAYVFEQFAAADLRSGALVRVLDKHELLFDNLYLYYPSRQQLPGKLRAFIEHMRDANAVESRS